MLENTIVSFVLLIPVLTMGLFAGEKKSGTDKLLYCLPLPKYKIVLGKFIAASIVFLSALLINFLSAVVMMLYRGQTFGEIIAMYLGFALLGISFISVGMFISSLTDSQIISAILSLCVCFTLYLSDWLLELSNLKIIELLALTNYYSKFSVGILDIKGIIYFVSFSAAFAFLTILHLEKSETKIENKKNLYSIGVIVVVCFFMVNLCTDVISKKIRLTFDMSQNSIFELTEETEKYLDSMKESVTFYYLGDSSNDNPYITEVLNQYHRAGKMVTLKSIDVIKNPSFTAKYVSNGETIAKGAVIVESNDKFTVVEPESSFYVKRDNSGNISRELGFSLETKLTQALDYVLSDNTPVALCLTGHGENGFNIPASMLKTENIQIDYAETFSDYNGTPDLVIIFAPAFDAAAEECELIKNYLDKGGKLFLSLNPGFETPNIAALASEYGMVMESTALTVDNMSDIIQNNRLYLMTYLGTHKITDEIAGDRNLLVPVASPVSLIETKNCGITALAITDDRTAEREILTDSLGEKIRTNSYTVIAISENLENNSAVLLASSSQWITPMDENLGDILNSYNYANADLFKKSVKYLMNCDDELLVSPKSIMSRSLNLSSGEKVFLIIIFGGLLPLLAFLAGFVVFKRRRNR